MANEKLKRQFNTKRKSTFLLLRNEISEMKETVALGLGILGLKIVFLKGNEIMSLKFFRGLKFLII